MKIFKVLKKISTALLCVLVYYSPVLAEGGKNLTPSNNGVTNYTQATPLNNSIGALQNGDNAAGNNYTGFFLYSRTTTSVIAGDPAFTTDHRLKIRMKPGETLYYGVRRTDGRNALTLRIMAVVSGVETVIQTTTFAHTTTSINTYTGANRNVDILNNGQAGVIANAARMNAGPAAIVGAAGYNARSVSLPPAITAPTDVWVEFWDDAGGVCVYTEKDVYDLWDFSVYDGTVEKPGRLHSKFWSFQAMTLNNRLSDNFVLFPAIPNDAGTGYFIKGLNLRGMQAFGFSFVCNATGTLTDVNGNPTTDFRERRKSKLNFPGIRTDMYPQYNIFVNDPDIEFWPSGSTSVPVLPFNVNTWCADPLTGRGSLQATILFLFPAIIQIYGELNGVPGYQPLTADVLFEVQNNSGLGFIYWNGYDGLGNLVPSGTILNIRYRVQRFPVHYPIYDPENNDLGFRIEDRRPFPNGTTGFAYWDDTQLVPGSSSLIGTSSASGVHPWGGTGTGINAPNIGNINLMNTWGFGAVREVPLVLPFIFGCDTDGDGDNDRIDIDDDDDGIVDVDESPGVDAVLDSDGDGIVDYLDLSFPGYIDANFDGINDNFDKDGDRIINQLDLDSDNDGIPDVVESYGVDADGNGRIDNYSDTDSDGLSENVDESASTSPTLSIGLGEPDFDNDGVPNYLDKDSDNDGIPDIIEAKSIDANNNGLVDDLTEVNTDGLVSPLLGESFADTDRDGFANSKDTDADNNGIIENITGAILLTSTDTNNDGRPESYPYKNFDKHGRPNPYDIDCDNDGLTDILEAGMGNDVNNDGTTDNTTGNDGWDDVIDAGVSLVLRNTDGTGDFDFLDADADDDGIPDNVEAISTSGYLLPLLVDTDNDGLIDVYDPVIGFAGGGLTPNNQDGDLLPDYIDTDTDGDFRIDIVEGNDFNFNATDDDVVLPMVYADTDGDGLHDFFDMDNTSTKGTSARMGNSGSVTGDASPGSRTVVARNYDNCSFERDWRCITGVLSVNRFLLTGIKINQTNRLSWIITCVSPAAKFIVEEISGSGNTIETALETDGPNAVCNAQTFSIQLTPAQIKNEYRYRVKVIFANGSRAYSNIITLKSKEAQSITILPNPVNDFANIEIVMNKTTTSDISLYDQTGRLVYTIHKQLLNGHNLVSLKHLSVIPEGVYSLKVTTPDVVITEKLIIRH
jgi:Secretion system C-terminal sorting domain